MKWLLGFLPSWVPFAAVGLLIAGLVAGYFGWRYEERQIGAAQVVAADKQAVIEQKERDALLSANIIADQQAKLTAIDHTAGNSIQVIHDAAPSTCPPSPKQRAASHGVRDVLVGGDAAQP